MSKKKAYVIGTKVNKSLSPLIFNHWFEKYKINATYDFKVIKEKNFNKEIKQILKEENLCGLNVTIPFKEKILNKMDKLDKASKIIQAVNCVTIKNNKYYGSNTDWLGFGEALLNAILEQKINNQKNGKVILLGYGGAAKAILYNLSLMGTRWKKNTFVFNRSKKSINIPSISQKTTLTLSKLQNHLDEAFLIINTTPRNILADLKIKKINKEVAVCDIVYKPKETKFLKHFTNPSAKIYGIHMLINQARPCFFNWFGVKPAEDQNLTKKIIKRNFQMITIGLTGGIASGKTTITKFLKSKRYAIHDSDFVVKKLYSNPTKNFLNHLKKIKLSNSIKGNKINKKIIRYEIFNNNIKKRKLEQFVHKEVGKSRKIFLKTHKSKKTKIVILDIPLLFEAKLTNICDYIVLLYLPKKIKIQRAAKRKGMTKKILLKILDSQISDKYKKNKSDFVINTSKSKNQTFKMMLSIIKSIV